MPLSVYCLATKLCFEGRLRSHLNSQNVLRYFTLVYPWKWQGDQYDVKSFVFFDGLGLCGKFFLLAGEVAKCTLLMRQKVNV